MMRKLNRRGGAGLEFCLVAVPLFTLMFLIFDLARYAITAQSLHVLADAAARGIMINCYTNNAVQQQWSSIGTNCASNPLSTTQMKAVAPFLYLGGLTPTLSVTNSSSTSALTVTASQTGFAMIMPIWGNKLNAPSASTSIPY